MQRPVLVTGAFGFIGRNLARALAGGGRSVIGLGHGSWTREEWVRWGLSDWRAADVTLDNLITYGGEPEFLFHCAGGASVAESVLRPHQDFHRTVVTTAAVLEYVRVYSPTTRVVVVSSAGVYGETGSAVIEEETARRPISPYGVHKAMAEDLCASCGRNGGVSSAIVRLFSVYGPGLRKQLLWDACRKAAGGESGFFGTGREERDWIHVRDAVALLVRAAGAASPEAPVFNGGTGVGVTTSAVLTTLFAALGGSVVPSFSGQGRAGDPARLVADATRAHALGWKPQVPWRDGLGEYADWYRSGAL